MPDTTNKRSYSAGHFQLDIDGEETTAYLKTVDGGYVKATTIDEPIGPYNLRVKHTSVTDIDPISFEFGLAGSHHVLKWIRSSWKKQWSRRNGQITHADFNMYRTFEHEFTQALITETTFPALDAASKEAAYIKVKLQPEGVAHRKPKHASQIRPKMGPKQKMWVPSAFRLKIDGIDGLDWVSKIESFTIKQGVKWLKPGDEKYRAHGQVEPTKIEFPNLVCSMSLQYADAVLKWYEDAVVVGQSDDVSQRNGSIEFLDPTRTKVLFRIRLSEVGIFHLAMEQSTANAEAIKKIKFQLFVGEMDLDGNLGMDS